MGPVITMVFLAVIMFWTMQAGSEWCLQTAELADKIHQSWRIGVTESLSIAAGIMVVGLAIGMAQGLLISVVLIKIISGIVN